jgi:hypothetical protein
MPSMPLNLSFPPPGASVVSSRGRKRPAGLQLNGKRSFEGDRRR